MPPGKYRPERGGLVELHTTVHQETRAELERVALCRFGTARAIGRLLDEDYMQSRPYEPTQDQKNNGVCRDAYIARCSESETIDRLAKALERAWQDAITECPECGAELP